MAPTTFLLVRHGHTAGNGSGAAILMGGRSDVPLSSEGEAEAAQVAARLELEATARAVYASPLRRAAATAEAIAARAGREVRVVEGLREIDCGDVDGQPIERVMREHAGTWAANERQEDDDFRWPQGESYRELRSRCLAALDAIARVHPGERVIVVTHAGVVSQIVGAIRGTPAARWSCFRPGTGTITVVRWSRPPTLAAFGDGGHLPPQVA